MFGGLGNDISESCIIRASAVSKELMDMRTNTKRSEVLGCESRNVRCQCALHQSALPVHANWVRQCRR